MNDGLKLTSKYHPLDAEHLVRLVTELRRTCGVEHWDVSLADRGLLVTESEHAKLYGYLGSIRPGHINEDCNDIVQAALLRKRR